MLDIRALNRFVYSVGDFVSLLKGRAWENN